LETGLAHDAGRAVRSAPVGRWRVLVEYAGLAAEVSAAVVIGLLIMILVLMLNPSLQDASSTDAYPPAKWVRSE
jgi:hypothetical protein